LSFVGSDKRANEKGLDGALLRARQEVFAVSGGTNRVGAVVPCVALVERFPVEAVFEGLSIRTNEWLVFVS
jgi:hypothetical protein